MRRSVVDLYLALSVFVIGKEGDVTKEKAKRSKEISPTSEPGKDKLILPHDIEGKTIQSLEVYQMDEALCLDLHFVDDTFLELIYRVGFRASATLHKSVGGNYEALKKARPFEVPHS